MYGEAEVREVLIQGIGFVGVIFYIVSYQVKSNRGLYFCQILGSISFTVQFILLGGIIGSLGAFDHDPPEFSPVKDRSMALGEEQNGRRRHHCPQYGSDSMYLGRMAEPPSVAGSDGQHDRLLDQQRQNHKAVKSDLLFAVLAAV